MKNLTDFSIRHQKKYRQLNKKQWKFNKNSFKFSISKRTSLYFPSLTVSFFIDVLLTQPRTASCAFIKMCLLKSLKGIYFCFISSIEKVSNSRKRRKFICHEMAEDMKIYFLFILAKLWHKIDTKCLWLIVKILLDMRSAILAINTKAT